MLDNLQEQIRKERLSRKTVPSDIESQLHALKKIEPSSDDLLFRLNIAGYEFGDLQRALVYAKRFRENKENVAAYHAEGKLALADLLTQLQMLCISLGWQFEEIRRLGVEHLRERQNEFIKDGWVKTE